MPTTITPLAPTSGALSANLLCMGSMLIWAMGFPAVDLLLPAIPPLQLTALRMGLAALFLVPLWVALDGLAALRSANWRRGLIVGGFGFGLGAFFLIVAQNMTDAVTVAVIAATMPVIGVTLECLLDKRALSLRLVIGLTLGVGGGVLAYAARIDGVGLGFGALAVILSLIAFCWASRETVKGFPDLSPIGRTALTLTGAAALTGIAALVHGLSDGPGVLWENLGPAHFGALALYSFGALALSQILWLVGVARLGIGLASMHINAAPFYVMIFIFLLGGSWNWMQVAGAAIVAFGVLVA